MKNTYHWGRRREIPTAGLWIYEGFKKGVGGPWLFVSFSKKPKVTEFIRRMLGTAKSSKKEAQGGYGNTLLRK